MLWTGVPILVAFASFAVAAADTNRVLTSDVIFPAIALFNLLQFPLAMFSQVTSNTIEAIVSIKRLSDFLGGEELQKDARIVAPYQDGDEVLSIKQADFSWSKEAASPTLEGIDLSVKRGELVGVMGRVGCGKVCDKRVIFGCRDIG
jgi:ATP-binding cassette, subfamily C (CFTR/MRP), member 1